MVSDSNSDNENYAKWKPSRKKRATKIPTSRSRVRLASEVERSIRVDTLNGEALDDKVTKKERSPSSRAEPCDEVSTKYEASCPGVIENGPRRTERERL